MSTTYSGRIFTVGDTIYFSKFGTTISSGYSSKSGTFGTCYGKISTLYASSYAFPIVISGTVTAGTGGTFTGCTVKPADCSKGYQVKVTYSHNGGSGTGSQTGYVGKSLTGTSSRTGYTFAGWYTAASGGSKVTTIPTDAKTYYAHWTAKSYTVTFNANGGSSTTTRSETYASNYTLPTNPTRTGYTFAGWYTATSGGSQVTTSTKVTTAANHTLYARWTANSYSVAFNGNGASGTMTSQSFTYGTPKALSANTFDRGEAYLFIGWNTQADGSGNSYADEETVTNLTATNNATVNLYAQWELQYLAPSITNISAIRSNANGDPQDDGQYLHITFYWSVDVIVYPQNYATELKIKTKAGTDSNWTTLVTTAPATASDSFSYTSTTAAFNSDITYDIRIELSDYYGTYGLNPPISAPQATAQTFLSLAYYTMDWAEGGHGMGIGAPAPTQGLQVGMESTFASGVNIGSLTLQQYIGNIAYPVGSYFITEEEDDPATLFGGTWSRIQDRFILAKGSTYTTAGATGGAATVTLEVTHMPSHAHELVKWTNGTQTQAARVGFFRTNLTSGSSWQAISGWESTRLFDAGTTKVGGGTAHNNMPPYRVANVWKRTALAT